MAKVTKNMILMIVTMLIMMLKICLRRAIEMARVTQNMILMGGNVNDYRDYNLPESDPNSKSDKSKAK